MLNGQTPQLPALAEDVAIDGQRDEFMAKAATVWCADATAHQRQHGGKPWTYLLIPHDVITDNKTLQGLAATYTYGGASSGKR